MNKFAIVAMGYNRPKSIKRLLNSLKRAEYLGDEVSLIISIDNSGDDSVELEAKEFIWPYGPKIIKTYKERLGLRNHVLSCGDLVHEYEDIAVFEDDIVVSPAFYKYSKKAIEYYKNDDRVAGISLYSFLWNQNSYRSFTNIDDRYDTYFMQVAQSWGQVWSKNKWEPFRKWYLENKNSDLKDVKMPSNISKWPETSWLKYHMKYLIDNNKYFAYPKVALATNFTDVGQHAKVKSTGYQVNIEVDVEKEFSFANIDSTEVIYDSFFENESMYKYLELKKDELCVDLYGTKKNLQHKKYWLTMDKHNFKIIKSFGLNLRPHEANIIMEIEGNEIFLYDTSIIEENKSIDNSKITKLSYDFKAATKEQLIALGCYYYKEAVRRKIRQFFSK